MDEQKNPSEGFSLEDILREFGIEPENPAEPEYEEDVRVWGRDEEPKVTAPVADTVRLDEITQAVRQAEEPVSDETQKFTPVGGEEEEDVIIFMPPQEEKAEPYSEQWEPEYEQPMGDYVPPQPIIFRPKSRLQELKRKLVEGPERRYYELAELGLGKLQLAIFMNLLVCLGAVAITALYALDVIGGERMKLLVFGQFFALLLSALFGSYQLLDGFADLFKGKFSLNSLLIFSLIASIADAVFCLQELRMPVTAAFTINMTMSLWSTYQKRNTEMGQMDTMRKATRLDSLVSTPDYYEGRPGVQQAQGQVEDFMDTYNAPSGAEKTVKIYALAALGVSIAAAAAAWALHGMQLALQVFCGSLLVATPATMFVTISRPKALLQRRLHKFGTVICGWDGVKGLSRNAAFPLTDTDLFPLGCAKMNGLKFYGSRKPDEVVAYGAALITACGGTMAPLFSQLLESRNGYHYDAQVLRSYPGGVGGEVNGEAVLAGSLAFMQAMGVDMPEGTRVNSAVYVAIDGELGGVFAVSYTKSKDSAVGLATLCSYRGLTPVLVTGDFMLTESFIRSKFGINIRRMAFPSREVRSALQEREPEEESPVLALTTREGLAAKAYAVTGARSLRSATITGVVIHLLGGILGLGSMAALAVLGAGSLITSVNILLFQLLWIVPGLLVTEWTRNV